MSNKEDQTSQQQPKENKSYELSSDIRELLNYNRVCTLEIERLKANKNKKTVQSNEIQYDRSSQSIKDEDSSSRALLELINTIGKADDLHFDNMTDAVDYDNLTSFLQILLKNDEVFQKALTIVDNKEGISNEDKSMIITKFLGLKEPKFNVSVYNFDNPTFKKASAVSLYYNLFDYFFLTKTREELFDRCYTILYGKLCPYDRYYKDYNDKQDILNNWCTYFSLINFINEGKIVHDENKLFSKLDFFLKSSNVPIILRVNSSFSLSYAINTNLYYYQLELIFNSLDNSNRQVFECFLIALRKIRQIKIPSYDQILKSVRAKNIALIIQMRRRKEISKSNTNETIEKVDLNQQNTIEIEPPLTFEDRQSDKKNTKEQINSDDKKAFKDWATFWNQYKSNIIYCEGILIHEGFIDSGLTEEYIDNYWTKALEIYMKEVKWKKDINTKKLEKPCFEVSKSKKVAKLYKFYSFDEEAFKWKYNSDVYESFLQENAKVTYQKAQMPIVFLLLSREDDCISLSSKIILDQFPRNAQKENEICVYGTLGLPLSMMNINFDSSSKMNLITPLFLFIHVPKSKHGMTYIDIIVEQMNMFLFTISDLKISILNERFFSEQIKRFVNLYNVTESFQYHQDFYDEEVTILYKDDQDDIDDDDELYKDDAINKNEQLLNAFYKNFKKKEINVIFLLNDQRVRYVQKAVKTKDPFAELCYMNNIKIEFNYNYNYIDINDSYTFQDFFNSLHSLIYYCVNSSYLDAQMNFTFIKLFRMSSEYNLIRNYDDISYGLRKKMEKRYSDLKLKHFELNGFVLISKFQKEIFKTFPLIDIKYAFECNSILSEFNKDASIDNTNKIEFQLQLSSIKNMNYLAKVVNTKKFWTSEQIENLKNGHIIFLKKEFFSIIKKFYPEDKIPIVYEDNEIILKQRILDDDAHFKNIFADFAKNLEIKQQIRKVEMEEGTNYQIREIENEREIKVRVELNGNIEDLIPTDY